MKNGFIHGLVFALLASAPASAQSDPTTAAFGAREAIEQISMSPDGSRVAFIAPAAGQGSTLIVRGVEEGAKPLAALVASGKPERFRRCDWVSNERLICKVFGVEKGPDGLLPFERLLAVDADGKNVKMLSTQQNEYSRGLHLWGGSLIDRSAGESGSVLITRTYLPNDHTGSRIGSDQEGMAVDRVDTATLKIANVEKPRLHAAFYISDGYGAVRIRGEDSVGATEMLKGTTRAFYRLKTDMDWKALPPDFDPAAIDRDRDAAYGFRKKDGRRALYRISLDGSLKEELMLARPDVDVDELVYLGRHDRVIGASYATDRRHRVYFDAALEKLSAALSKALPDQPLVDVVDSNDDESKLLLRAGSDNDPGVYYVLDRKTRAMSLLQPARPQLEGVKLSNVRAVSYPAADGTLIPGYLTLPPQGLEKNLPAIVLPHGGPSARDEWGFDWLVQYYANRGFAVLQPNFRGSSGYGDAYFGKNGFQGWRLAIGDVLDAGHWLVAQGIANPDKLAVVGWSYGGYAALQSAIVDQKLFKAVVAIAPVTDLTMLREERRNWNDFDIVSKMVGTGPVLLDGSPAQNASSIKVPVLLFHGMLDRNVGFAESKFMDARLAAAGVPHELVSWPDLDHYLDDSDARISMLSKSDAFLRKAMGM